MKLALRLLVLSCLLALGACSASCGATPGPSAASPAAAHDPAVAPAAAHDPAVAPSAASPQASGVAPPQAPPAAPVSGPGPARYHRAGVDGVIVPERDAPRFLAALDHATGVTGHWTPAASDVDALEQGLAAWIGAAAGAYSGPRIVGRLSTTRRQYVGLVRAGRRLVLVNAFCADFGDGDAWTREPVAVDDGGDCFYSLVYDVAARSYGELQVNGEA